MAYKIARAARKGGDSSMEIEGTDPSKGKVVDKTKPEPHTESLVPPLKPGEHPSPKIGPPDSIDSLHAEPGVAHEGDKAPFSGIYKT